MRNDIERSFTGAIRYVLTEEVFSIARFVFLDLSKAARLEFEIGFVSGHLTSSFDTIAIKERTVRGLEKSLVY